jgi:two-component system response regulator FixJ
VASAINEQTHSAPPATVFIVDDDEDIRRTISLLVRSVGLADECYATAQEFLEHFDPRKAGCLVLDLRMPGMSGLELQRTLRSCLAAPPVIFLSGHGEIPVAIQALQAGAVDFIEKPFRTEALLDRIREAIRIDERNRRQFALHGEVQQRLAVLSQRERQVMDLLVRGDSSKEIAKHLSISPKTVDNHRANVLQKMQVENTVQLACLVAIPDGLSKGRRRQGVDVFEEFRQ